MCPSKAPEVGVWPAGSITVEKETFFLIFGVTRMSLPKTDEETEDWDDTPLKASVAKPVLRSSLRASSPSRSNSCFPSRSVGVVSVEIRLRSG